MRLDKYIYDNAYMSRRDAKEAVLKGFVTVNGERSPRPNLQITPGTDEIAYKGKVIKYEQNVYFMLNKPDGVVSANTDAHIPTVIGLFKEEGRRNLSCVGRLDKDTTGLMIVTDDGDLIHRLTSPSKHVFKDYLVTVAHSLSEDDISKLENGVDINDPSPTMPAKVKAIDENNYILSICEGRFHQVKRMMLAVGNEVTGLKRLSIGNIKLDESLKPGEYRRLTEEELKELDL